MLVKGPIMTDGKPACKPNAKNVRHVANLFASSPKNRHLGILRGSLTTSATPIVKPNAIRLGLRWLRRRFRTL